MKKLQSYTASTRQVRIDTGWANILARMRADNHVSMKSLIEDALAECYTVDKKAKPYRIKHRE